MQQPAPKLCPLSHLPLGQSHKRERGKRALMLSTKCVATERKWKMSLGVGQGANNSWLTEFFTGPQV